MIRQPSYLIFGIFLSILAFYLFRIGVSYWWVGTAAFLAFGSFGVSTEEKKINDISNEPGLQEYKTTVSKFTSLKKFNNSEMGLDQIKKRYGVIAEFYNNYKFNLYNDISNRKIAEKQMNDIVNVLDKNLNDIAHGTNGSFLSYPMIISGMVHFKFVTKKRVTQVHNDLKRMHKTGELLDFDDILMGVLESILGI
tara:strand:- start:92 stop:676 length:585 start_codon:yes stop_codon:yes gene_type:complete